MPKDKERKSALLIWKEDRVSLYADAFQYIFEIESKDRKKKKEKELIIDFNDPDSVKKADGARVYIFANLEDAIRELIKYRIKKGLKRNPTPDLKEMQISLQKALLYVKEVVNKIPFREIPESQDVKVVNAEEYFSKERELSEVF